MATTLSKTAQNGSNGARVGRRSSSSSDGFEFVTQSSAGGGSQGYRGAAAQSQESFSSSRPDFIQPALSANAKGKQKATADPLPIRAAKRPRKDAGPSNSSGNTTIAHNTNNSPPSRLANTRTQVVPVTEAETPMIQRNIAMRTQADDAANTAGKRRGRRASSIGSGYEDEVLTNEPAALPHPTLADDTLHRHIDPSEPESKRFVTISAWAASRAKDRLLAEETHTALADAIQDQARRIALQIVDQFSQDIRNHNLDLSFPLSGVGMMPETPTRLAPNAENTALQKKEQTLDAWVSDLVKEDESRRAHVKIYAGLKEAAQRAANASANVTLSNFPPMSQIPLDPSALKTDSDVLALGRSIRAAAASTSKSGPRKSRSRASMSGSSGLLEAENGDSVDLDTLDVEQELGISFANMRLQANNADMIAHRLENFVAGCSSYTQTRQHMAHAVFERLRNRRPDANRQLQLASSAATRGDTESLLSRMTPANSADPMETLRAIARQK